MDKSFKDFMDAELQAMLKEVEPKCPRSSPNFNENAIEWVRTHASQFRREWNRQNHLE